MRFFSNLQDKQTHKVLQQRRHTPNGHINLNGLLSEWLKLQHTNLYLSVKKDSIWGGSSYTSKDWDRIFYWAEWKLTEIKQKHVGGEKHAERNSKLTDYTSLAELKQLPEDPSAQITAWAPYSNSNIWLQIQYGNKTMIYCWQRSMVHSKANAIENPLSHISNINSSVNSSCVINHSLRLLKHLQSTILKMLFMSYPTLVHLHSCQT